LISLLYCIRGRSEAFTLLLHVLVSCVIQGNVGSPLTALDTTRDGFCHDMEVLDNMSSRTCDTVHVFYVRAGQKTAEEILSNVVSYTLILSIVYVFAVKAFYYHLNFLRTIVL